MDHKKFWASSGSPEKEQSGEAITEKERQFEILLFNDDVNTFDFVINSLVEVCKHDREQAEQCTLLVHYTGKCSVKTGSREELVPLCSALLDRGLSAEVV